MTGDLGNLAKPIPTRSLTLPCFVHFPLDPDSSIVSKFLELRGSYEEVLVSIFRRNRFKDNSSRKPSHWDRYPRVSMIFLEDRGKSNEQTIELKFDPR